MVLRKVFVTAACLSTPVLSFLINAQHMALARIDPLVNPGVIGNHVHAVVGGSAFDINYDADKYKNAACTSVETPADKSNYWMPAVYGYRDGVFSALPVREVRIYYFTEGSVAFPDGFRMLAGSPNTRAPDENQIWYCQQGSHSTDGVQSLGRNPHFPLERCWDFLRSEITFPNCWTGDTSVEDTTGQTAHAGQGEVCPDTHPIKHPKIVLEFGYNSSDFDPASLVLANGDTSGYGLHGDFAMGWDRDLLQALIDDNANCNARQSPFGGDSTCSVLKNHVDRDSSYTCTMTADIPQEEVGIAEPISALPGCNLLWTDNSTKPTCDNTVNVAFGPATEVFQSYGASYADFKPGQLPIYLGDADASTGSTSGSGTNTTTTAAGSNNTTTTGSTPKASTSTGAVAAAATTARSSNAGTSGSSSTTSSSDSASSSSSLTSNPILLVALGAGAMLLIGVGIYIFTSQRNKSKVKAEQDKAKAVEEGRRLQKSDDETSTGSGSYDEGSDGGKDSGSDTAVATKK